MWGLLLIVVAAIGIVAGIFYAYQFVNQTTQDESSCRVLSTRILPDGTRLEVVNDECKEGLPHTTTSNTVRMTQNIANSSRYEEIMTHERVHLDQKTRPDYWRNLVKRVWAYDLSSTPPDGLPAHWAARRRPNPDTDAAPWAVWRGRYVFFAAYGDDHRLSTAPTRIWDLQEKTLVETLPDWQAHFCKDNACPHQSEHPYEIAAEYITHQSQSPASAALSSALQEMPWRDSK
jgi:hypothetical protein